MKTSELIGAELNKLVARAEGHDPARYIVPEYSSDWLEAGPIIEREGIDLTVGMESVTGPKKILFWCAGRDGWTEYAGPTPLVAAMRCYVASKFGESVEDRKEPL